MNMALIMGFICDGIFRTQEDIDNHAKQKYGNELGDLIYRDLDNNGTVDDNDRTVIGKSTPDYVLGLNLTASYPNFDFSALFQSLLGYQVWGQDNWDNPNVGKRSFISYEVAGTVDSGKYKCKSYPV